ncbi:hypothetical protein CEP54_001156 [Fusarium duplospermum]|uniref:DUF6546 domain-containing protein n=1 Tax=Fusarium duplospermum TaxID=1325734 RepID=A0A428R371_9HYPO|nr:hypothetical protein CEP54_001156 [Fusarium duplospermum]
MALFYAFPQEIQQMILSELASIGNLPSLACVDKHWQEYFEARSFRHLIINQNDIEYFEIIVQGRRRHHVKHLWLRILLPTWPWVRSSREEEDYILWRADRYFTGSIFDLFEVLSQWDGNLGIAFELSVHSPSDRGEYVQDDFFEREVNMYKEYLATNSTKTYKFVGDVYEPYFKVSGKLCTAAMLDMWHRAPRDLFGWKPLEFNFHEQPDLTPIRKDEEPELSTVSVISKFLIRRSQFREIFPIALGKIWSSLPHLDQVAMERWRCVTVEDEEFWSEVVKWPLCLDLPLSAKTLSLYGDTADIFHEWSSTEVDTIRLAKYLRNYGKQLENMSISFLIDAKEFFQPFWTAQSGWTTSWENLKTLSLTCRAFKSFSTHRISGVLCAAANAAMKMPKLQLLELWDGVEDRASVFRYRVVDTTVVEVTWLSTHILEINQKVIDAWTSVALAQGRPDIRVSTHKLDPDKIRSAGSVLQYLHLRDQILHPVSRYRIDRVEAEGAGLEVGGHGKYAED